MGGRPRHRLADPADGVPLGAAGSRCRPGPVDRARGPAAMARDHRGAQRRRRRRPPRSPHRRLGSGPHRHRRVGAGRLRPSRLGGRARAARRTRCRDGSAGRVQRARGGRATHPRGSRADRDPTAGGGGVPAARGGRRALWSCRQRRRLRRAHRAGLVAHRRGGDRDRAGDPPAQRRRGARHPASGGRRRRWPDPLRRRRADRQPQRPDPAHRPRGHELRKRSRTGCAPHLWRPHPRAADPRRPG